MAACVCACAPSAYFAFIFATAAACKFRDREHHFVCICMWHEIFDRISFFMVEIFYFIIYIVHQLILLHIIHMSQVFFLSVFIQFLCIVCEDVQEREGQLKHPDYLMYCALHTIGLDETVSYRVF